MKPSLQEINSLVVKEFDITHTQVHCVTRGSVEGYHARTIITGIARQLRYNVKEIGNYFGRDYSTVCRMHVEYYKLRKEHDWFAKMADKILLQLVPYDVMKIDIERIHAHHVSPHVFAGLFKFNETNG